MRFLLGLLLGSLLAFCSVVIAAIVWWTQTPPGDA